MQEIRNFCWKGCELYFLWVCCIRAWAYFSKAEVLMACLTFLQCRRWGPTTCASRCTQCTQLVHWAFRLGAEIVVEGGNACNWRYPSELYQNFTLIIHCELPGNCTNLTRSLTWNMTVWFWLWQIKESQVSQVSQVSPPFLKIRTLNAFGCFGGELGHCRHSSLRSGRRCEGPGEKQGDAVVAMDNHNLIVIYAVSDYVRQMEWGMHMHCMSSVHYKSNDLHAQSFMFFVQVLDAPKSAQAKVQKVCIFFLRIRSVFDTVVLMFFLLETLAQRMHKRCIQVHMYHMFCTDFLHVFHFSVFWNICRTYAQTRCTFSICCLFLFFFHFFGPAPTVHMQDFEIGAFLFACFFRQENTRNRNCQYIHPQTHQSNPYAIWPYDRI